MDRYGLLRMFSELSQCLRENTSWCLGAAWFILLFLIIFPTSTKNACGIVLYLELPTMTIIITTTSTFHDTTPNSVLSSLIQSNVTFCTNYAFSLSAYKYFLFHVTTCWVNHPLYLGTNIFSWTSTAFDFSPLACGRFKGDKSNNRNNDCVNISIVHSIILRVYS